MKNIEDIDENDGCLDMSCSNEQFFFENDDFGTEL